MGIPIVATGCPTYAEWQAAEVGWYVDDVGTMESRADQWYARLLDMVKHYDSYKTAMSEKFTYAQEWWVDNRASDIAATYQLIIDRFHGVT